MAGFWTAALTFVALWSGQQASYYWTPCAGTYATAGWTAPACLVYGVASLISLASGLTAAYTGTRGNNHNNPAGAKRETDTQWYKLHDSGFLEDYSGRLNELYGSNETHTMVDFQRGYTHQFDMFNGKPRIKTDMTQSHPILGLGLPQRTRRGRQAEAPGGASLIAASKKRGRRAGVLSSGKNQARSGPYHSQSHYSSQLSEAVAMLSKIGSTSKTSISSQAIDSLATSIANNAPELGKYCVSINGGGQTVLDMGLTFGAHGEAQSSSQDEGPCTASSKRRLMRREGLGAISHTKF